MSVEPSSSTGSLRGALPRLMPGARLGAPLPRDTRDTLFLLAVIGWTVLPHLSHLPAWCVAMSLGILAWRGWLALRNAPLPSRWTLVATLVIASVLTWWSYRTIVGREAGITLLVVLAGLKTLELRARRDTFVVFFLGFFLVLTNFLYSQSLATALAMVIAVWGLLTALVVAHMPVGQPALAQAAVLSLRTALFGAPVMAALFVLFPRVAPLWGVPSEGLSRTGLSNTMSLGGVADLAQDDSVAMRVRFDGPVPPPDRLYFRGPVLSRFDGREWRASEATVTLAPSVRTAGPSLDYEMTVEPLRVATLPMLEYTPDVLALDGAPEGFVLHRRSDLSWIANQLVTERMRVRASAFLDFRNGPTQRNVLLGEFMALPDGFNPRTVAWAREFKAGMPGADPRALANALLQRIRTGGYTYTLAAGEYGADAIDEFWLDRKEGFCEHFAAAFVVALRAMDVPARVVTGYLGGQFNSMGGYLEVRNSDAHAWAEFWQPGIGWMRADPTAAVAPDRVLRGQVLVPRQGLLAGAIGTVNPTLLARLREAWGAVDNRWNQWVLNYSRSKQLDLLRGMGFDSPDFEQLAYLLFGLVAVVGSAGAAWAWWEQRRADPWVRMHRRVVRALVDKGLPASVHMPPRSLAALLRERFGDAAGEAVAALLAIEHARYAAPPAQSPRPPRPAVQARSLGTLALRQIRALDESH